MPTFVISVPPSTNRLFANVRQQWARQAGQAPQKCRGRIRTKEYSAWIAGELKTLIAQRARPVQTPVKIEITRPSRCKSDLDNSIKAVVDLMVRAGVIPNDKPEFVHGISINFGDVESMHVSVNTIEDAA